MNNSSKYYVTKAVLCLSTGVSVLLTLPEPWTQRSYLTAFVAALGGWLSPGTIGISKPKKKTPVE